MPMIQPDLSEVGPIEPGSYKASIEKADPGVSKSGGQKLVIQFAVDVGGKKRIRQVHMPVAGAGAFGFATLLRAVNMNELADAYSKKGGDAPPFDTDSLIGQELIVTIESDIYNGAQTDKITGYVRA